MRAPPPPQPLLSHFPTSPCHKMQADLARSHTLYPRFPLISPKSQTLPPRTTPGLFALQGLESTIQPPLLSGHEAQAGLFVLTDKRKKAGRGRRINLSAGQTTHLLVVSVSFLSLPWFPFAFLLLSLVRAEDIGSRCMVDSQGRDTPLIRSLFCVLPFLSSCCPRPALPPSLFHSSGIRVP